MKKLLLVASLTAICLLLSPAAGNLAFAQKMSKQQEKALKKQWKGKAKTYVKDPLALKRKEDAVAAQIDALNKKIAELSARYTELQAEMDKLQAENRRKSYSLDSCKNEFERMKTAYEAQKTQVKTDAMPGLVFRVQVGAYEKFNMNQHITPDDDNFTGESAENLNKYLMGKFRSYNLAVAFRDDIKKLGIRDAFVVAYNDGVRIDIKQAIQMAAQGESTVPAAAPPAPAAGGGSTDF